MALPARWSQKIEASDPADEIMELQMGPSHPAAHGTIKFNLKLDGERVADCDVEVGYLHRAFEKMCEQGTWTQCFPYTDRLNYASPMHQQCWRSRSQSRSCSASRRRSAAKYRAGDHERGLAHHRPSNLPGDGGQRGRRGHGRFSS